MILPISKVKKLRLREVTQVVSSWDSHCGSGSRVCAPRHPAILPRVLLAHKVKTDVPKEGADKVLQSAELEEIASGQVNQGGLPGRGRFGAGPRRVRRP